MVSPNKKKTKSGPLTILQWNCRGLKQKREELNLRLAENPRDALLIQETKCDTISLRGYNKFFTPSIHHKQKGKTVVQAQAGIYLDKELPFTQIDTSKWCNASQEVVAVRTEISDKRICLVSTYCRPGTLEHENDDYSGCKKLGGPFPTTRW